MLNVRDKRRREFATGRWCGRRAMQGLDLPALPIGMGGNREPIWPRGVVGSISHCDDLCCAVVSREKKSMGVDLEKRNAVLEPDLLDLICVDREREQLGPSRESVGASGATLIFSAKEAFYKLAYPSVKRFVGFLDVRTIFQWREGTFEIQLMRALNEEFPLGARLQGRFSASENHVLCFMSL